MISTLDQRNFYLDDYNPISTMTVEFSESNNLKAWISTMFNITITDIISPKILLNVLRDCQNVLPKQILSKIGKIISNPTNLFYTYLKTLMLFDSNPVCIFNETPYSLFEEKDLFNKALQKYIDPLSYLYSIQIISLLALAETRIQIMKRHKESDTKFLETFEQLINCEIAFNSCQEFSVIDLKGLTSEIDYLALSFLDRSHKDSGQLNLLNHIPTLILKVSEGLILLNTPTIIRELQKILETKLLLQAREISHTPINLPVTEEIIAPVIPVDILPHEGNKDDELDEPAYQKMKKIGLSEQKSNFMVSGNLQMGMSLSEEEFTGPDQ